MAEKGYKLDIIQSLFGSVGWAIFQVFQVVCLAFTGVLALRAAGHHVQTLEGLQEEAADFAAFIADQGAEQCRLSVTPAL